ncbi:protein rep [Salicola sp. Rm-C-2C1-2]|uniref:protein rep n=1 Tax=Salicola sp. Rm-C-2C1-2 TaxID=3141321 RepID=UPI0032E390CD
MTVIQETRDVSTPQNVRAAALQLAEHLIQDPWTKKVAARIHNCALRTKDTSQAGCHHPHCPSCQHQKAYDHGHQMDWLFREKPWQGDSQWVAVSFSVRQCQVTELSECLEAMKVAFRRMTRRRFWSRHVQGALRILRVDQGFSDTKVAHPRFECVLLLRPDVSKDPAGFREDVWHQLWRDCFGEDFIAEVHPENVEPIDQDVRTQIQQATIRALRPRTPPTSPGWFLTAMPQMDSFRWMESFGDLRRLIAGSHDPNAM